MAVTLTLFMLLSSLAIGVPPAYGITVDSFAPTATLISSDESVQYQISDLVDPANVHFSWNFSNGMDTTFVNNLEQITLVEKYTGQAVQLAKTITRPFDGVYMGTEDFLYTKSPSGARLVELILTSTTLLSGTDYVISLGPNFQANNGSTLGKTYSWNFTTQGSAESEAPTWPEGSNLSAAATPTRVVLQWPEAQDNTAVIGYTVYQETVALAIVDENTLSYTVTGLASDTEYTFAVKAIDVAGNYSEALSKTCRTPAHDAEAPTWPPGSSLSTPTVGDNYLTLNWTPANDNYQVTDYKVFQGDTVLGTVYGDTLTYTVSGLTIGTEYTFKVEAGDECGNWSENGPGTTVQTMADITVPTWQDGTLTYSNLAAESLTLEWTGANDNIGVVGYYVYQNGSLQENIHGSTSCNITGLSQNTEYSFRVEAYDSAANQSTDGPALTVTTPPWSPTAGGGFDFNLTTPVSTNITYSDERLYNRVNNFVYGAQVYFCWDFDKGLDQNLVATLQKIRLKNKNTEAEIPLDRGNLSQAEFDAVFTDVITLGDFTYTKQNVPEKIRRLEFNLSSSLEENTEYIIELAADITCNEGSTLGKIYSWEFKTWPGSRAPSRLGIYEHSVFVDDNGNVWTWGTNSSGQLGRSNGTSPAKIPGFAGVKSVSSMQHVLALKEDGTVWSWGQNNYGQLGNGTNQNNSTPSQVQGLTQIVKTSAGSTHSLVLKDDGTVWAWGQNNYGQLGDGTTQNSYTPIQISSLSNVADIAAGQEVDLALKKDGTVWAWGRSYYGQLGTGSSSLPVVQIEGLSRIVQISVEGSQCLALADDGTLWTWGYAYVGLGPDLGQSSTTPLKVEGISGIKAIAGGSNFSMVLKDDGSVWTWGRGDDGQLGNGSTGLSASLVQVSGLSGVVEIEGNKTSAMALKDDGTLWTWGKNNAGQLGDGTTTNSAVPVQVPYDFNDLSAPEWPQGSELTADISFDSMDLSWTPTAEDTLAYTLLVDGTAVADIGYGTSSYQLTGLTSDTEYTIKIEAYDKNGNISNDGPLLTVSTSLNPNTDMGFTFMPQSTNISYDETAVHNQVDAFVYDNISFCWSLDNGIDKNLVANLQKITIKNKATGTELTVDRGNLTQAEVDAQFVNVITMGDFTYTKTDDIRQLVLNPGISLEQGAEYVLELAAGFTWNNGGTLSRTYTWDFKPWPGLSQPAASFSSGNYHSTYIDDGGNIRTWGYYRYGLLGDGSSASRSIPASLEGISGFKAISAGGYHTLALKEDGTIWAWGRNNYGQLGIDSTADSAVPVQVPGLSTIADLTTGSYHSAVLKEDGTVWTWGRNSNGQLGDGSTNNQLLPVQVSGLNHVVAIAAGGYHTLALKEDGTVWAWGRNSNGQLGDGTNDSSLVPVQVRNLSDVTVIGSGFYHSLALKSDGRVWAWGRNNYGQLGDGTNDDSLVPVQVSDLTGVRDVAGGNFHSLALKDDGTVWAWGYNNNGQLGDGSTTDRTVPVQVSGLTEVSEIAAGYYHNNAMKNDGTLWSWGDNNYGQLGDGTNDDQSVPVQVLLDTPDTVAPTWTEGTLTESDVTQTELTLIWSGASDDTAVTDYRVYQEDSLIATVNNASTWGVTGLSAGTSYTFKVEAGDAAGNWSSDGPSRTIQTAAADPETVATPAASPGSGELVAGTLVTLTTTTDGATIYYTLDGSTPTASSTTYSGPFAISSPVTVKAIAVKTGMTDSGVLSAAYTIQEGSILISAYSVAPAADAAYTSGETADGINTMTVNPGYSGETNFTVNVSPVTAHAGSEKAVFVQLRNGQQANMQTVEADFDTVNTASASFDVQPGDLVKVLIVDDLYTTTDTISTVLEQ